MGATFSAGMYLAGLESLSRMIGARQPLLIKMLIHGPARGDPRQGERVMRKQLIESAAYEVATQVRAVEDAIEEALQKLPSCRVGYPGASHVWNRHGDGRHEAFEQLAERPQPGQGARRIGPLHLTLKDHASRGLRTVGFGDMQNAGCDRAGSPARGRLGRRD